jgi:hypothetical protein
MSLKEYDDDLYFEILDQMDDRIGKAVMNPGKTQKERFVNALKEDHRFIVTYSAYELDSVGMPSDNLDEVPHKGTFVVVSDNHWGDCDYKSEPITNPTWLELCVLANAAINITGDDHHVFLEAANRKGNKLHLSFGS